MKAKTNEREQVTITASEIITGLWGLLNAQPAKDGTLRGSQRTALHELLTIRGGQEFVRARAGSEVEKLLHCAWQSAHQDLKKTRANLKRQALATALAMLIFRGQAFAGKTTEDRSFYWRHGHWPSQLGS